MTRTLILMRHAKSSWDAPGLSDHDRPLNARGRRAAAALGDWMRAQGWNPDQVLCSTARRTRETLAGLEVSADTVFSDQLYHASAGEMLRILSAATGQTVLMVGHNPGIASLAHQIVAEPPAHSRFADYPTGATLIAGFNEGTWQSTAPKSGVVLDFVVPRDLP